MERKREAGHGAAGAHRLATGAPNECAMSARKRRVVAYGHYGFGNFGDELFTQVVRDRAGSIWPGSHVRVFAPRVDGTARSAERGLRAMYRSPSPQGLAVRGLAAVSGLTWAELVALCGGSVIRSFRGVQRLHLNVATRGMRRFEALGVSVGPFPDAVATREAKRFLGTMERLIVRDWASLELAERIVPGVAIQGGDLAALAAYPRHREERELASVGIIPCSASGIPVADYLEMTRRATTIYASHLAGATEIVYLSLNSRPEIGDDNLARYGTEALRAGGLRASERRFAEEGIDGVKNLIARMDAVFAGRLHGAVVAYLTDVPFAIVEYDRKCSEFAEDVGLPTVLRLTPQSSGRDWEEAAAALAAGVRPEMPAATYRRRAESAYLGGPLG